MSEKKLHVETTTPASSRLSRKRVALLLLVLQNSSVSLLTRSSRKPAVGTPIYSPGVAVFVAELLKCGISLTMLVREKRAEARSKEGNAGAGRLVQRAVSRVHIEGSCGLKLRSFR